MEMEGEYRRDGFALVTEVPPRGTAQTPMAQLRADLPYGTDEPKPFNFTFAESPIE